MKGPGLQYDLRALRVFLCRSCGRQISMPGSVTSHLCGCTEPPQFMSALDRAAVTSPDVTAFLSPPDPSDVEEEDAAQLEAEEAYVPYVPQIPVRPPQHPGRRKLSEEIERYQPAEFGAGLSEGVEATEPGAADRDKDVEGGVSRQDRGHGDRSGPRDRGRQRDSFRERGHREQGPPRQQQRESGHPSNGGAQSGRDRGRADDRGRSGGRNVSADPGARTDDRRRERDRRSGPREAGPAGEFVDGRPRSGFVPDEELTTKPAAIVDEFGSGVESVDDRERSDSGAGETGAESGAAGKRRRRRRR